MRINKINKGQEKEPLQKVLETQKGKLKLESYDIHRAREKEKKRAHAWDSGEGEEETRIVQIGLCFTHGQCKKPTL